MSAQAQFSLPATGAYRAILVQTKPAPPGAWPAGMAAPPPVSGHQYANAWTCVESIGAAATTTQTNVNATPNPGHRRTANTNEQRRGQPGNDRRCRAAPGRCNGTCVPTAS